MSKNILGTVKTTDGHRYIVQTWDFVLHLLDENVYQEFKENAKIVGEEEAFKRIFVEKRVRTLGYPIDYHGFYGQIDPDYDLK